MSNALHALARHCGIVDSYADVWGNPHVTSDDTRRALLRAMYLPLDTVDPSDILRSLEDAEWRRPLPPVLVVRQGEPLRIELSMASADAKRDWQWHLHCESGQPLSGTCPPTLLPRLGQRRLASADFSRTKTIDFLRFTLELPGIEELGYHRFEIGIPGEAPRAAMRLIVVPTACYQPEAVRGTGRVWGPTVQLYGLRSRRNWGIGDFTDLRNLVDMTADAGGGIVGINPLHALFPDNPAHFSPYSPSSRSALNVLYLDVEAMPEFRECNSAQSLVTSPSFQARLRSLRAEDLVNYPSVSAAKREVLDLLFRHFCEHHLQADSAHARAFTWFREQVGLSLARQAQFDALQAHFRAQDANTWGWPAWPEAYHDPEGPVVDEFVASHASEVDFHFWLQWHADCQLAAVGRHSWQRGLGIGLYADFAVGANPGGAEGWTWQGVFARGAYAGAPPEAINLNGQDWGLPPFIPHRLRASAYEPLIAALRENMRHVGALRIDHAMCLTRLFWVPAGRPPTEGTYVSYPLEDLLGIVALESQRNQCLIIGEDLGTVPAGFRSRLASADILSYRPLFEERSEDGAFLPPEAFPGQALVAVSTHDMPTLAGFWKGRDLDTRTALQLFPTERLRESLVVSRAQDRARLLVALERENLLPEGAGIDPVAVPELGLPHVLGVYAYLALSPSRVLVVQPEDILGMVEQANLPGTMDDQHPNWRRRLTLDLEDWRSDERFTQFGDVLRRERGSAVTPQPAEPEQLPTATIPRATYRFQFNQDFTFRQATERLPYLAALGISHVYASPYLKARPGSSHGYDIVDHGALNPEIGSAEDYERFVATLHAHGMGQILDVVPNHMGVMGADNAWWLDVLENGPAAGHGSFFDIDWEPLNPELKGKVLLPLLGDHYGEVLERGELKLGFDAGRGEFRIDYYQHRLPIDPASYPMIVGLRIDRLAAVLGEQDERYVELQTLLTAFARLPARMDDDPAHKTERQRDKEVHKRRLATLCTTSPDIVQHIDESLAELNGRPGEPASFDALHALIQAQGYRLAFWRVASHEINYRRFFDINDLAALRMEDPTVFESTHRFVLDLVRQGKVDGLRIDHPDGLYDPGRYFAQLQEHAGGRALEPGDAPPLYLVIEKILAEHEQLPADWPIHGATGYRFANLANNLFIDTTAKRRMTRIYADFIGTGAEKGEFEPLVHQTKQLIMDTALSSELNVLANRLARIAALDRRTCDFTLHSLRDALAEVVACFPVYRTYVSETSLSADDRRHIDWAVGIAKKHSPAADLGTYDFIQSVLTTDIAQGRPDPYRMAVTAFAMKFQQFSSPVMAKGVEDTAFYRYHRLSSLNDVGGAPRRFGISVSAYHAATRERMKRWPHNLLATSTHDSKRSEDVRCRIDVLSEMPAAWKLMLKRWSRLNRSKKRQVDGGDAPSANDEYLIYQTLIGTWPLEAEVDHDAYCGRIVAYLTKAVREAKEHSSWINVNVDYEAALADFITALLTPGDINLFLTDFVPFAQGIAHHGLLNSLSLTLLKLTAPGVPDIYQGCELWQFNLVDPDNRQPIDYDLRHRLLDQLDSFDPVSPLADPRHKLALIRRTLALRAESPELFRDGDYLPLTVKGKHANHVCAYARRIGDQAIIVVVPRLAYKLLGEAGGLPIGRGIWKDTEIELPKDLYDRRWENQIAVGSIELVATMPLASGLATYPIALFRLL